MLLRRVPKITDTKILEDLLKNVVNELKEFKGISEMISEAELPNYDIVYKKLRLIKKFESPKQIDDLVDLKNLDVKFIELHNAKNLLEILSEGVQDDKRRWLEV